MMEMLTTENAWKKNGSAGKNTRVISQRKRIPANKRKDDKRAVQTDSRVDGREPVH